MPTSPERRAASLAKRQRICDICGVDFIAKRARHKNICSQACNLERNRRLQRARSDLARQEWVKVCPTCAKEHVANRKSSLGYCSQECRQVRISSANLGRRHTDEYKVKARERYAEMKREGRGICSEEARQATKRRVRWVMKKARDDLTANPEFVDLWKETKARLELENPFSAFDTSKDWFEYRRMIGHLLCSDRVLWELSSRLMSEALRLRSAEWRREHGGTDAAD